MSIVCKSNTLCWLAWYLHCFVAELMEWQARQTFSRLVTVATACPTPLCYVRLFGIGGGEGCHFMTLNRLGDALAMATMCYAFFLLNSKRTMRGGLKWQEWMGETDVLRCRSRTMHRNYFTLCIPTYLLFCFSNHFNFISKEKVLRSQLFAV